MKTIYLFFSLQQTVTAFVSSEGISDEILPE